MTDCIEYPGGKTAQGYGKFKKAGKWWLAHRWQYTQHHGQIPEGKVVRHTCDNPACWNIGHLELGTQKENIADCFTRGRANRNQGEDVHSHVLTEPEVREIKQQLKNSYRGLQSKLARQYNVSRRAISDIHLGKTWKHID